MLLALLQFITGKGYNCDIMHRTCFHGKQTADKLWSRINGPLVPWPKGIFWGHESCIFVAANQNAQYTAHIWHGTYAAAAAVNTDLRYGPDYWDRTKLRTQSWFSHNTQTKQKNSGRYACFKRDSNLRLQLESGQSPCHVALFLTPFPYKYVNTARLYIQISITGYAIVKMLATCKTILLPRMKSKTNKHQCHMYPLFISTASAFNRMIGWVLASSLFMFKKVNKRRCATSLGRAMISGNTTDMRGIILENAFRCLLL
jgi:hypothetical protein